MARSCSERAQLAPSKAPDPRRERHASPVDDGSKPGLFCYSYQARMVISSLFSPSLRWRQVAPAPRTPRRAAATTTRRPPAQTRCHAASSAIRGTPRRAASPRPRPPRSWQARRRHLMPSRSGMTHTTRTSPSGNGDASGTMETAKTVCSPGHATTAYAGARGNKTGPSTCAVPPSRSAKDR